MARELLVLSGNAHPDLAGAITNELDINLVQASVGSFPDGETRVRIADNVREQDVFLVQPTGPPTNQNVMESLVMVDALRRSSAARITAVIPYFGYGRQDRKSASREPITAKLITNLYAAAGVDRLLAVDLHAHQIQGFTDMPFDHLYAARTMAEALQDELDEPVVVAPDVGAGKMARGYAKRLNTDWAIVDKDRTDATTTRVAAIIGHSVAGRTALIVDDMVTTAGSLLNAAEALKEEGAERVVAAVTHGVLCDGAVQRVEASEYLDHMFVTDSLPTLEPSDKISRVTLAPLLAQAITNIHEGKSISVLF